MARKVAQGMPIVLNERHRSLFLEGKRLLRILAFEERKFGETGKEEIRKIIMITSVIEMVIGEAIRINLMGVKRRAIKLWKRILHSY